MFKTVCFVIIAIFLSGCTPSIGVSVPIGGNAYTGVSVSEHGVQPSVGVGIGL